MKKTNLDNNSKLSLPLSPARPGVGAHSAAVIKHWTLTTVCVMTASMAFNSGRAEDFIKPAYLKDLGLEVKEGYDDNVLAVSRLGMGAQASWITTISPKVVFDFAPLIGDSKTLQSATFSYTPDYNIYENTGSETYFAHKVGDTLKLKTGSFTAQIDNAFLYNDGNDDAPTYALNQTANQLDKNRSFFAQAIPRERRKQIQDRSTVSLQYDLGKFFIRPTASLLYYDLQTRFHNTSVAPYKGYQNWPDRNDVNGGADLGYHVVPDVALTLGYRYGHQYQQQFNHAIDADNHTSSSDYQRVLLGVEGKPASWLAVKLDGGPDFRDYGTLAAVNDRHPIKYFGEACITGTISKSQTLTFTYKQWQWVSSTGKVPYFDSLFNLNYHWSATKKLGFDLCGKIQEADFTSGNDGTTSLRDDRLYSVSGGIKYAFNAHVSASVNYSYDIAGNVLGNPGVVAPDYRNFKRQTGSAGLQYKF
jgi:hypothetical protein